MTVSENTTDDDLFLGEDYAALFMDVEQKITAFSSTAYNPNDKNALWDMCLAARDLVSAANLMEQDDITKAVELLKRIEALLAVHGDLHEHRIAVKGYMEAVLAVTPYDSTDSGINLGSGGDSGIGLGSYY